MRLYLSLLLASLLLLGCGQKGPLYKAPAPEENKAVAAENAASEATKTPATEDSNQKNSNQ